jgi:uncharacterized protein
MRISPGESERRPLARARRIALAGVLAAFALLAVCFVRPIAGHFYQPKFLTYGPNGPETPASVGLTYERVRIPSGNRQLDAFLVNAEPECQPRTALLIFHGVGETISQWVKLQRFLHDHCVSSMVFDFSGYGDSSKPGTIYNMNQDAVSAYSYFALRFADTTRRCALGHSLGNGPMLQELPLFRPAPACAVDANGFSAFRDLHASRFMTYLFPREWDNMRSVAGDHPPLLVVSSDGDRRIPFSMGQRVFQAASQPKMMLIEHGFPHDALFTDPSDTWWTPVLAFLRGQSDISINFAGHDPTPHR